MKVVLKRWRQVLLIGLCLAFHDLETSPLRAQLNGDATVMGTVLDPAGKPLPNAAVSIKGESTSAVRNTTTDTEGHFSAKGFSQGTYSIEVSATGFSTTRREVTLTINGVHNLSFNLKVADMNQALWTHVMKGEPNPALHVGLDLPQENVSWDAINQPGGFLERSNQSAIPIGRNGAFRLPTETEWEYAARGGPHWRDGFPFSGSHDSEAVAWYHRKHGDHTQPVKLKAPNQLGLYYMSGNIWEWCQDTFVRDVAEIPADGSAFAEPGVDRVLRGGCFHNWAVHCTVNKRYEIARDAHDGCIGFRLVFA